MALTSAAELGFAHRFVPSKDPGLPLLLLHGTGGDENDLIPLGERLAPAAALLSPRGKVLENGMPRFFHRLAEGVFDAEDLRLRAAELAAFVADARTAYGLEKPIAVGFSNGANIAAALLLLHPETLSGAVLIRAMLPLEPEQLPDLKGLPVLILSGATDPIIPAWSRDRLAEILRAAGADVSYEILGASHALTGQDMARAGPWIAAHR